MVKITYTLRRRSLDVYSAAPNSERVSVDGYEFAALSADYFASAEFCKPRLSLFRERLTEGFAAHGLLTSDGELAYYMWLSFWSDKGWAPWALGARISLPESSGYIFDCKTAPEHRNKGLYTFALKHARRLCQEVQCEKVLIDVEPHNDPAIRAIRRAGFNKVGNIDVTKFGPVFKCDRESQTTIGWGSCRYEF